MLKFKKIRNNIKKYLKKSKKTRKKMLYIIKSIKTKVSIVSMTNLNMLKNSNHFFVTLPH